MPTGYTAGVADGSVTKVEEFVVHCARALGVLAPMRDASFSTLVPEQLEPSTYNLDRKEELELELERVKAMSEQQLEDFVQKLVQDYHDSEAEYRQKHSDQRGRYETMIAEVEALENPPEGLREFALQQLRDSLNFDCREPFSYWGVLPNSDPEVWRQGQIQQLEKDIAYHDKQNQEELARTASRNEWLRQLWRCIGGYSRYVEARSG